MNHLKRNLTGTSELWQKSICVHFIIHQKHQSSFKARVKCKERGMPLETIKVINKKEEH